MNILEKIISTKEQEIREKKYHFPATIQPSTRNFAEALTTQNTLSLITEIKKSSPSRGDILPDANIIDIAQCYESHGAAAISVLTDTTFFKGSVHDFEMVRAKVDCPMLRKDFILTNNQITESRCIGADAVLLMVSVLKDTQKISDMIELTHSYGMQALVEVHSREEITTALRAGAKIIGINSRDFHDLSVNTEVFSDLRSLIPESIITIAESGIRTSDDIKKIRENFDAALIGTVLMENGEKGVSPCMQELQNAACYT